MLLFLLYSPIMKIEVFVPQLKLEQVPLLCFCIFDKRRRFTEGHCSARVKSWNLQPRKQGHIKRISTKLYSTMDIMNYETHFSAYERDHCDRLHQHQSVTWKSTGVQIATYHMNSTGLSSWHSISVHTEQ